MRWPGVVAWAVGLAMVLAACGTSASNDQPALAAPPVSPTTTATVSVPGVPHLSVVDVSQVEQPQLIPANPAVNTGLHAQVVGLVDQDLACTVSAVRLDAALASFRWICIPLHGGHAAADQQVSTATYDLTGGRRLSLADLFTGGTWPTWPPPPGPN